MFVTLLLYPNASAGRIEGAAAAIAQYATARNSRESKMIINPTTVHSKGPLLMVAEGPQAYIPVNDTTSTCHDYDSKFVLRYKFECKTSMNIPVLCVTTYTENISNQRPLETVRKSVRTTNKKKK